MIKNQIKSLFKNGFFNMLGANMSAKIIAFIATIVLARVLDVSVYGLWVYSYNILAFFILIQGLGSSISILQYCSSAENDETKDSIFKFGIKLNSIINLVIIAVGFLVFTFVKLPLENSSNIIRFLLISTFSIGLVECLKNYFRARLMNSYYSYIIYYIAIYRSTFLILLGIFFKIQGLVIAEITTYFTAFVIFFLISHKTSKHVPSFQLSKAFKKKFYKFSLLSTTNNLLSQMLYLLDTFLIGQIMTSASAVAIYRISTVIPFNLNIIPITILLFLYPRLRSKSSELVHIKATYYSLMKKMLLLNSVIVIPIFIFAPLIIRLLFSTTYIEAVPAFRILLIGYFFVGTFRIPAGNLIAAIDKVGVNTVITVICGTLNIVLDYFLIKKYGINGAAYATTSIFIFSSILSNSYLISQFRRLNNESSLSE